jgi:hypothetical protein
MSRRHYLEKGQFMNIQNMNTLKKAIGKRKMNLILSIFLSLFLNAPQAWSTLNCRDLVFDAAKAQVPINAAPMNSVNFYPNKVKAPDYDSLIKGLKSLQAGTILDFGGGDRFVFEEYVGAGGTTVIVKIDDGSLLRIPKLNLDANPGTDAFGFVKGHQTLKEAGISVVGLDIERSRPPKFLVVENLHFQMTLEDLKYDRVNVPKNEADRAFVIERLLEFARSTWKFRYWGDFNETQLAFDGKKWILFDIATPIIEVDNLSQSNHIFSPLNFGDGYVHRFVAQDLQKAIDQAISKERERRKKIGQDQEPDSIWFKRPHIGGNDVDFYFISEEQGISGLKGSEKYLHKSFLRKSGKRVLNFRDADYEGSRLIQMRVGKLVAVGNTTALFAVTLGDYGSGKRVEGYIEVLQNFKAAKDAFAESFPLLKKRGFKHEDLAAIGTDYVLVVDKD